MSPDHGALALVELVGTKANLANLDVVENSLKCQFGGGIDDRVPDRGGGSPDRARPVLEATWCALCRLQALEVCESKTSVTA